MIGNSGVLRLDPPVAINSVDGTKLALDSLRNERLFLFSRKLGSILIILILIGVGDLFQTNAAQKVPILRDFTGVKKAGPASLSINSLIDIYKRSKLNQKNKSINEIYRLL